MQGMRGKGKVGYSASQYKVLDESVLNRA